LMYFHINAINVLKNSALNIDFMNVKVIKDYQLFYK